jgi:hypothetical protein
MHAVEIPERKIKLQFASCIEEMHPDDFLYMLKLLLQHQHNDISMEKFRDMLCLRLLKIKKNLKYHRMSDEKRELVHDNFSRISELLDSFFIPQKQDGKEIMALNLIFIRNMIPRIGRYHGPEDALTNCTIFEYKQALLFFNQYNQDRDESSLNHMIAVLYRPLRLYLSIRRLLPSFNGENREPFTSRTNPRFLEKRSRKISKLPTHVRTGIYLWFSSCVIYLREGKPIIDGNEIDLGVLYQGSDNDGKSGIGLAGLLYSLSESGVFGNLEKTSDSNLYDIMARLYQLKVDYDNQISSTKNKS